MYISAENVLVKSTLSCETVSRLPEQAAIKALKIGVAYKNASQGGESLLSKIWNSNIARLIVPDMISLNIGASFVFGKGTAFTHEVHLVTRGQDAGLYNSYTTSKRVGFLVDLSAGVSVGHYIGSVDQINYSDYLGDALEAGGKFLDGVSISQSFTGPAPTWLTIGGSAGFSVGGYVGSSYTYPMEGKKF